MIPASIMGDLLESLLKTLLTPAGEPDYMRHSCHKGIERRFKDFFNVIMHCEDDLSFIITMIERDMDCMAESPILRLQALVDYVQIACAIYVGVERCRKNAIFH